MPRERRPSELEGGGRARVEEANGVSAYRCRGRKRGRVFAHMGHARAKFTQRCHNAPRACTTNRPAPWGSPGRALPLRCPALPWPTCGWRGSCG